MSSVTLVTIGTALQVLYLLGAFGLLGLGFRYKGQGVPAELRGRLTIPVSGLCVCTALVGDNLTAIQHMQVFVLALLFAFLAYQTIKAIGAGRAGVAA